MQQIKSSIDLSQIQFLHFYLEVLYKMQQQLSLDSRFQVLRQQLPQETFIMADIERVFPELNPSTRYWLVSELVKAGYIQRVRRGTFAFNEWRGKRNVIISKAAEQIIDILSETGYDFYISGLDILSAYMHHVPEQYPIMLFADKEVKNEIRMALKRHNFFVYAPQELENAYEEAVYAGLAETQVVMYLTDTFEYANDGLATIEKAFVDTYFAVTRNSYPLPLQELVRIYKNLIRTGNIDRKKLVTIANRRSIQYDMRYIVESRYITDGARKFVEIMGDEY